MAAQCHFWTYRCHKCNKVGHLQSVCPADKGIRVDKENPEKQQGQRKSKSIQQLQADEALEENHIWVITGGHKEGYRLQVLINGKPDEIRFSQEAGENRVMN